MKINVDTSMIAQTVQYQSDPWVVKLMSEVTPLIVSPVRLVRRSYMRSRREMITIDLQSSVAALFQIHFYCFSFP